MTRIIDVESIGAAYAGILRNAGVSTTEALLERGATPKGRDDLAEITGISSRLILKWVSYADLFRINGVAGEYAELLEAVGVDTVANLAQRQASDLANALTEMNRTKHLVRRVPSETRVAAWIAEASILPRRVQPDTSICEIEVRTPQTGDDIFAGYDAESVKAAIRNAANIFTREEAEEIIQNIYAGREQGSRPVEDQ